MSHDPGRREALHRSESSGRQYPMGVMEFLKKFLKIGICQESRVVYEARCENKIMRFTLPDGVEPSTYQWSVFVTLTSVYINLTAGRSFH